MELIISADGHVRSAKVKLHSGRIIGHPLKLLFPVEVSARDREHNGIERNIPTTETKQSRRPIRKAAEQARKKYERIYVKILMIRLSEGFFCDPLEI